MDTLVICPSRGRPGNVSELVDAWNATTWHRATLLVCVDADDPELDAYLRVVPRGHLVTGPRRSLCGWLNLLVDDVLPSMPYTAVGFIGDDVRPRTPGWDAEIAESMQPNGVVYGNDLHQRERLATHPFIDADLIRRFGFLAPPGVEHLYVDNFWHEVGKRLGTLVYRDDIVLEHLHPHAGKAEMDDGYRRVNSREQYDRDKAAYERFMADEFDRLIEGVKADV